MADLERAIVRRQVESVTFGLYSDEEVRTRSICEVTSPIAFDALGTPLPGGLYDPLMGPSSKVDRNSCVTCGNLYSACPGHSGHLELCVPAYHPLLFSKLLVILKTKCMACHKLRMASRQALIWQTKFHLLDSGHVQAALSLDHDLSQAMHRASSSSDHDTTDNSAAAAAAGKRNTSTGKLLHTGELAASVDAVLQERLKLRPIPNHVDTSFERETRRLWTKEALSHCMGAKKCQNCGAASPKIRHDAYNKIFNIALADANQRSNDAAGIVFLPASSDGTTPTNGSDSDDDDDDNDEPKPDGYASDDSQAEEGKGGDERGDDTMSDMEDEEGKDKDALGFTMGREATAVANRKSVTMASDVKKSSGPDKFLHALEVEAQVRATYRMEPSLCRSLFGSSPNHYFLRAIPVPPARFRPPMVMGTMTVEHAQNFYLQKVIQCNERVRTLMAHIQAGVMVSPNAKSMETTPMTKIDRNKSQAMAISTWIDLQTHVNCFMDSSKDPSAAASEMVPNGIRQLLEKKEGIFRKHMMGKRVDFCCRSVISPDPYVGTSEIGIPLHFAKTLTYPTPVTALNITEMRKLVKRGPNQYPGAVWVEFPDGRRVDLGKMNDHKREAVAATLLKTSTTVPIKVGRQVRNGDMMLVNRQPTLHKPGIMAHFVRVLHNPTQKTIRMHYANCNTYNADFDGDEMNCHFPQNDLARAESEFIAATDLQFIVPTDGTPLRGLIQDHVDSGVKMTCKDTFLEKWEYQQLIFAALASLPGLEVIRSDMDIELMPPTIRKPRELWTGKQVITTLLHHLRRGNDRDDFSSSAQADVLLPGISMERKTKTPPTAFGESMQEHLLLIRDGELLRGILDKAAFGATDFSLVHAVYEAYGPSKSGLLLNSLGRLFTAYLQFYSGHSCRMEDLVLTPEADHERRELVKRVYSMGSRAAKAWADSEGGKVEIKSVKDQPGAEIPLKPVEVAATAAKIGQLLSGKEGPTNFAALDGYMQSQLNPMASQIIKTCLPNGLAVPFPANTFGLMVTTGAKGSTVNQSQVSCGLGQQALEGRRVPRMSSGRTLPSFAPYDPNPRADGFIADRFLTGVRPQEYYFHCMAGREGLVDTAVKTSRSGYLQRCLVKHLEELKVCYDNTVRDSEGGVVQFLYGEDGVDPTKAAHLDCSSRTFQFMARNHTALSQRHLALPNSTIDIAGADSMRVEAIKENGDSADLLSKGSFVRARKLRIGSSWVRGALCRGWFDAVITNTYPDGEHFDLTYTQDKSRAVQVPIEIDLGMCGSSSGRRTRAVSSICTLIEPAAPDPILSDTNRGDGKIKHRLGSSGSCVSERVASETSKALKSDGGLQTAIKSVGITESQFEDLMAAKYSSALCAPGEAVGSIAAQSVGEPSTQMTLNTFHLAGAGANVTLGIPRLREIIMAAAKELKTPTMSVPLLPSVTDKAAKRLTRQYTKLTLMEVIASHGGIMVTEKLQQGEAGEWERAYYVSLKLHPAERVKEAFGLNLEDVAKVVTRKFIPKLADVMKKELRRSSTKSDVGSITVQGGDATDFAEDETTKRTKLSTADDGEEEEEFDDDDDVGEEDGVTGSRFGHKKEMEYEEMDDDDKALTREENKEDESDNEMDDTAVVTDEEENAEMTTWEDDGGMGNTVKIDRKNNCLILHPLRVDPSTRPLLMVGLVERAATGTLVRFKQKIDEAFINDEENGRGRCLQIAGINFREMWQLDVVDHNRLMSNDIWAIRCAYGVEAARQTIVDQIRGVFAVYGISVDPRHLSLIGDYMTNNGGYKAMNRGGMADCSSTFCQMSFETTAQFMTDAALQNRRETLTNPSAGIVLGRPIRHGTGAFDVLAK